MSVVVGCRVGFRGSGVVSAHLIVGVLAFGIFWSLLCMWAWILFCCLFGCDGRSAFVVVVVVVVVELLS